MKDAPLILMVDDDPNDRFLLRRAFTKTGVANPVLELDSGADAIHYLEGLPPYDDREKHPFPGILLLDLHMPKVDGFGVLKWIRDKLSVGGLLIIVLSRQDEMKNVNRAYQLGANSFLTKPGNPKELEDLISSFHDYWLIHNKRPDHHEGGSAKPGLRIDGES